MTLREEIEKRERQWRAFHEWESQQPPAPLRNASAVLADLSWLLEFCDPETILQDPDPEKLGIAKMRAALALISK